MKLERASATDEHTFEVTCPIDGRSLGIYRESDAPAVIAEMASMRPAVAAWAAQSVEERLRVLERVRQAFYARIDALVGTVRDETGKPLPEIYGGEIIANLELFDFYRKNAARILADERIRINPINYPGKRGCIQHRPLGIVGVLSSWNYPVALALRAIVPALVAGNGVVFKPSVDATLTGELLGRILAEELPAGVLTCAYGGRPVAEAIIAHADKINFIGSVGVGRQINEACARRFIPCSTELSGKDAAIVLADCDIEKTLNGVVWGAFTNGGQNCASIERVYVESSIYARFREGLLARVQALQPDRDLTPLRNRRQLELVERHIADARATGNTILCGGERLGDGLYFAPTVIEVHNRDAEFLREETFGPTLPLIEVHDVEEALSETNAAEFGLTTSLWTRDLARAEALARRIESGVVTVNNCTFTGALAAAPWGGVKHTGHGVTNSKYGLLEMTRPHFVLIDSASASKETWWYPYTDDVVQLMTTVIRTMGGEKRPYLRLPGLLRKVLATPLLPRSAAPQP